MTCHCSDGHFYLFKGAGPFKFKTSYFIVFIHFIVAWPVIVAAATNYVSHNGTHTGSVAPQDATTTVLACGLWLPRISLDALDDFSCAYLSLSAMKIGGGRHNYRPGHNKVH
jgi:hypothetical protein